MTVTSIKRNAIITRYVPFGKELTTLLAICIFCVCFIVCLFLWCSGFDVDLIVSIVEFSYLFFIKEMLQM